MSVSIALSNRGTVVMEAALVHALTAMDQVIADRSRAEASCMGCMPCLFQDCGQRLGTCGEHIHTHTQNTIPELAMQTKTPDIHTSKLSF